MEARGIYVGARNVKYDEKIGEDGKKIPAFAGKEYVFLWIERDKNGDLKSTFGYTLVDRREEGKLIQDIEDGLVTIGVEVDIEFELYNLSQRRYVCRYDE